MSRNTKIILSAIIILIVTSISVYFFAWRPSDSDYQSAVGLATYAEKTHRVLTVELSTIQYPGLIDASTPLKLQVLASAYKNAVDALNRNNAINRDFAVRAMYDHSKSTLAEHSQSMIRLANSIKLYTTVLDKCTQFTDSIAAKKTDIYAKLLEDCQSAINDGYSSGNKEFNDAFFTEYLNQTKKYIDALDKIMKASNDKDFNQAKQVADTAYKALYKLGEVKFDFKSPNVIAITKDLNATLSSQKNAFLR